MGTLKGDRVFVLHYDGFWMPFTPGKVNYSMYRGVERCDYEDMLKMWDLIKPERDKRYHLFVTTSSFEDSLQPSQAQPSVNKPLKPPTSNKQPKILSTPKATNQSNHEVRKSPRLNLNSTVPTTPKTKKQRVVVSEVRKSPRLNHVPSTTPTTPKAPNQTIAQLRKSPRRHPTPTTPMKAKKLYFEAEGMVEPQLTAEDVLKDWTTVIDSSVTFEDLVDNEVEDCDGGVNEDDEVDMFIQVGDEYGPSIKLSTAYVSEASSDEEDVDFVPNPIDRDSEGEEPDLVDEQPDLDEDNNDEDDDISAFVKLPKNLYADEEHERIEGNGTTEVKLQLLPKMEWRTFKECREFMKNLAIYQKFSYVQVRNNKARIHLKCKDPEYGWSVYCTVMSDKHTFKLRNYVETHSCEADGKNKNAQATCGWVADKLEGFLRSHPQMTPIYLILEVLDKFGVDISYYTAWQAKVRVLERINGRPKKQRIRGDDEEKATSKRKCKKCLEPGHNKRTCPLGKDQPSKKSRKTDEANEPEDIKLEVGNAKNNEGERAEEVVAEGGHDSPTRTRGGGRRRGGDNNVNVQLVVDFPEAEVQNLQNDVPRARRGGRAGRAGGRRGAGQHVNLHPVIDVPEAEPEAENLQVPEVRKGGRTGRAEAANVRRYGTRSGTGRGGGRRLGWWLGEDSQPPSTPGQSTPCIVLSESLTQSQPQ
ncbi:hypothetical protein IFM89_001997 [Coptis chinensis]|uniref:CCHC-type domain-containing protein n=1 Tax=Coptis chinensis TaxID=261450 RepID=A0A835LPE1_9MAGN|nr:hypothetical protein IFM89_001997 [Coptis chinensis]